MEIEHEINRVFDTDEGKIFISLSRFLKKIYFYFMCTGICLHVCLCTTCMPSSPRKPEDTNGSSGSGVASSCEPLHPRWKLNMGLLGDQPVLLTVKSLFSSPPVSGLSKEKSNLQPY